MIGLVGPWRNVQFADFRPLGHIYDLWEILTFIIAVANQIATDTTQCLLPFVLELIAGEGIGGVINAVFQIAGIAGPDPYGTNIACPGDPC